MELEINPMFAQIKLVYEQILANYTDEELQLILFRGFLLDMLAKSYGYQSAEKWIDSHKPR